MRKLKQKLRAFMGAYQHYRKGHVLVLHLGRWESFCRALEWAIRAKS